MSPEWTIGPSIFCSGGNVVIFKIIVIIVNGII